MRAALRVYWWALRNTYEELFTIAGINLAWWGIGFGLPVAVAYLGLPWLGAVLLLFLLPPPTAGVYYYANRISREKSAAFELFWEGTKKYVVKSWLVAWLGLLVAALFVANVWFYGGFEGGWRVWVQGLFVSLLLYWMAAQMYLFPMLLNLKEEKLLLAIRNAVVLVVANPLFTLLLSLLLIATIVLSVVVVLPAVFLMIGMVALIANRAVVQLLSGYRERTRALLRTEIAGSVEGLGAARRLVYSRPALLVAVGDAAPRKIIGRYLHQYPVAQQDPDIVPPHLPR